MADDEHQARTTPVGRRVVLAMLGLGAVGVATGHWVQEGVDKVAAALGPRDPTGLTDLLPAAGGFRYYSVTGGVPRTTPAAYRLRVSGLAERPRTLAWADLLALPRATSTYDFQCVTGWRVPGVRWHGVLLRDVLDAVGVAPGARAVRFRSADGAYAESLTLPQARRDDVLVAMGMQGRPLSHDHGGPVRLLVAPMYGYKSLKWLDGIELVDRVEPGYWEQRGYDVDAWVGRSNGRDDEPTV